MSTDWYFESTEPLAFVDAVAAILLVDGERYLLQLRDNFPHIFFPGHWGLFGGAIEPGETEDQALRREVEEEIGVGIGEATRFCRIILQLDRLNGRAIKRSYFESRITSAELARARLTEGARMQSFTAHEVLAMPRMKPNDAFVLWQHVNRNRLR
ncbi:MAG TPA: NUDIX domain-containing protein [Candidatus Binataceae bacterium]|nr:NUDIX domain-containing protein [Candidatus Binataceae bacterium]